MSAGNQSLAQRVSGAQDSALAERAESIVRQYGSVPGHTIRADAGQFHRLGISADGGTLAGAAGNILCVWDTRKRHCMQRFVLKENIEHIAVSQDGQQVVVAETRGSLHLIERMKASCSRLVTSSKTIAAIAADPACRICAYGTTDGVVKTINTGSRREELSITTRDVPIRMDIDDAGDLLLVVQPACAVVYCLRSGDTVASFSHNERNCSEKELPWSQIVVAHDSVLSVFSAKTGEVVARSGCESAAVDSTPDGTRIVAAKAHRTVIWDGRSDEPDLDIHTFKRGVRDVRISNDGELIYACGFDSTIDVHTSSGVWLASLADTYHAITGAALTSSDRKIVVSDEQGFVAVYDVESGRVTKHVQHDSCIAKLSVRGSYAATGSYDGAAAVLDIGTGETVCKVNYGPTPVQAVDLDTEDFLITGNGLGAVQSHEMRTGRVIREFLGNTSPVRSVCLSPNRRYLATTAEDGSVLLFRYSSGELLYRFSSLNIVYGACFDSKSESLFFGDILGTIKKIHAESASLTASWRILRSEVRALRYDNNRVCAVGLSDDAVMVDPSDGEVLLRVPVDSMFRHRVAMLSASGERFVTGAQDGRLRFHDAGSGHLMAELHHISHGFLWTTSAAEDVRGGEWFWTDRPELVSVHREVGGERPLLDSQDPRRADYMNAHNSRAATMARVGLSQRAVNRDVGLLVHTHQSVLEASRSIESLEHLGP